MTTDSKDTQPLEVLAYNAVQEAIAYIQKQLGIAAGDFAGVYFSGDTDMATMVAILERYAQAEIEHAKHESGAA